MAAKVPKGQAEKKREFFSDLGWVNLNLTTAERALTATLVPQIDTNEEIVMLSIKAGGSTGLESLTVGSRKIADGRIIITDRRIVILSESAGRIREFEYQSLERWERPKVSHQSLTKIENVLTFDTLPAKTTIKLVFVTKGRNQAFSFLPWITTLIDQIIGGSIFSSAYRQSTDEKITKTNAVIQALDSLFKTIKSHRNAGILA
jgi:hypothetical protein